MRAPPLLLALLSPLPSSAPRPRTTTDVWRYMGEASPWAGWNYSCFRCPAVVAAHGGVLLAFAEARTFTGDGCVVGAAPPTPYANRSLVMKASSDAGATSATPPAPSPTPLRPDCLTAGA